MKVIVVGAGSVGYEITKQLIEEKKDVVLIEKDYDRAQNALNKLDCLVINKSASDLDTLKEAGCDNAEIFISATESDEVNLIACSMARSQFNVPRIIARIRNLDYSRVMSEGKPFLGVDYVVTPEVEASRKILDDIKFGVVSDIIHFEAQEIQMRNFPVEKDSVFNNKRLFQLRNTLKIKFLISAILRENELIIPDGSTIIKEKDRLFIVANAPSMEKIFNMEGKKVEIIRKILIAGCGHIGHTVAKFLIAKKTKLTIIDKNPDLCKQLSEEMGDKALILCGDISEPSIFEDESLHKYDLVITATKNQELNLLTSIFAKSMGAKKVIALVGKSNYLTIASKLDIDATVSPKACAVDSILKYIRKGNIRTVHSIFDGRAEIIEYSIAEDSPVNDLFLKQISLPSGSIIVAISRDGKGIVPDGNFQFQTDDDVIVLSSKESIAKIEKFFVAESKK